MLRCASRTNVQLRLPQEFGPGGRLHLAVDQVQQACQEEDQHCHGDAEWPGPRVEIEDELLGWLTW